ncbi:MAG: ABC transporter substrate-binding protein [Pseudolabrys sp.]|jgi:putative ABC transport system substrate-binding protein
MRRREFITFVGVTAFGLPQCIKALAQGRHVRVGLLSPVAPTPDMLNALRKGLRDNGYVEGQNVSIEVRWPKGSFAQNPGVADELVRSNVDIIVAWTTPAVTAARTATSTIPIVMVGVGNPVEVGFIDNLARPGGNITGISNLAGDLSAKSVELLKEIVPNTKHVGVIFNPSNPGSVFQLKGNEEAIRTLGLRVTRAEASTPEEYRRAFGRFNAEGVGGVVLQADSTLIDHAANVADLAKTARLPTIFQRRENVEAGGLLSYGPNLSGQFRQAAVYVDRILKGASPAELPVEQPTTFEMVINLKTAKVLGLTVPPSLLARADEVIE